MIGSRDKAGGQGPLHCYSRMLHPMGGAVGMTLSHADVEKGIHPFEMVMSFH